MWNALTEWRIDEDTLWSDGRTDRWMRVTCRMSRVVCRMDGSERVCVWFCSCVCKCVSPGLILMPHSAGCVSFSLLLENPSRWHGNKRSARWRGAGRSIGAGESVYERFITDVALICHALSRSCSKAHTVNGFFPQTSVCRWLRVADGEEDGEGGLGGKYMVWGDEEEHFMGCITACPQRDGAIFFYAQMAMLSSCRVTVTWSPCQKKSPLKVTELHSEESSKAFIYTSLDKEKELLGRTLPF